MALDATVAGANANSYLTESEANTYLTGERLYITAWTNATTPQREQALIWATFLIDTSFDFEGYKRTIPQALRWPRSGAYNADEEAIDPDTIPAILKKSTATLALSLLTSNRVAEPPLLGLGIQEAKVGPLEVVLNKQDVKELIPDEVRVMLSTIGSLKWQASESAAAVEIKRA